MSLEGAHHDRTYVSVEEEVELRVLRWLPDEDRGAAPLVFVAGWVSDIAGWAEVVQEALRRGRPVYYIESREKRSARIARSGLMPTDFAIERLAKDIVAAAEELGVNDGAALFAGSSMGSTAIVEALKHGRLRGQAAFVIGPNIHFNFPWWAKLLIRMPAASYHVTKWVALFYLRHFRVDTAKEPQQMERYDRTLRGAHPQRMKLSAMALQGYEIWPDLATIRVPVAVAYSPTDGLHREDEVKRLADIPDSQLISCKSNLYMHSAEIVGDLEQFVARV